MYIKKGNFSKKIYAKHFSFCWFKFNCVCFQQEILKNYLLIVTINM